MPAWDRLKNPSLSLLSAVPVVPVQPNSRPELVCAKSYLKTTEQSHYYQVSIVQPIAIRCARSHIVHQPPCMLQLFVLLFTHPYSSVLGGINHIKSLRLHYLTIY